MSKKLVAYFSVSGVTRRAATELAETANADLYEIVPEIPYTQKDLDWTDQHSRSTVEMKNSAFRPAIGTIVSNMPDYDVVYVGFPIWWYVAPTIINTFLESYDFSGKTVVLFATSGGSDFGGTAAALKRSVDASAKIVEGRVFKGRWSRDDLESVARKGAEIMEQTKITLNNGAEIPQFGIGVYQVSGNEKTKNVCLTALKEGYRHIDTAHAYQNEAGVGAAVKESGIPREDIWITTKLWINDYESSNTAQSIDNRLKLLGTDYIDLLLIHQQHGKYMEAWREMEKAVRAGKIRSIGLSNFESERLEEVLTQAEIKPAVLQVECHPYFQQAELKERLAPYGTALESWYPIGHADSGLLNNPLFVRLAEKYNKSTVQVILRWHMQEGNIVFPRSVNSAHIKENIEIFDFELTADEMAEIRSLDRGERFYKTADLPLEEQEKMMCSWRVPD